MTEECYVRDCDDDVDGHILSGEGRLDILIPVCNKHCFTARNLIDMLESTMDGVQGLTDLPIVERWTPMDLIRPCIPSGLTNRNLGALIEMLHNLSKLCEALLARDIGGTYFKPMYELKIAVCNNRGWIVDESLPRGPSFSTNSSGCRQSSTRRRRRQQLYPEASQVYSLHNPNLYFSQLTVRFFTWGGQ